MEQPDAHLEWILERIGQTETETREVAAAHGLALAESIRAAVDLPLWDTSAMDGYAVRSAEIAGAAEDAPAVLRVVGELPAGSGADPEMPAGSAVMIMTGAPVPSEADSVVPVEGTRSDRVGSTWAEHEVAVTRPVPTGANIRSRSEDIGRGATVAGAGDTLGAARLAALAAVGIAAVPVHRPPRIAVVVTGSELLAAGATLRRGQIPESNSVLIAGLLAESGFAADTVVHVRDDADGLAARLSRLAGEHDAIITTGGIGPGRHDIVRLALEPEPEVRAVRVAVRPGQPQCAGRHQAGAFVFGLPGNPVSAAVSFELFVRPALRSLAGHRAIHRRRLSATAGEGWRGKAGRLQVLPVRIAEHADGLVCVPAVPAHRVSHSVAGHGIRDGYALVESNRGDVRAGEPVTVIETGAP